MVAVSVGKAPSIFHSRLQHWRVMLVLCLAWAMPLQTIWVSAHQLRGLAHQHDSSTEDALSQPQTQTLTVDMLRLGFALQHKAQAMPSAASGHQHASTGYHMHSAQLLDAVIRWLDPDAKAAAVHDTSQDNAGALAMPLGLLSSDVWVVSAAVSSAVQDFTLCSKYDCVSHRLERPPNA